MQPLKTARPDTWQRMSSQLDRNLVAEGGSGVHEGSGECCFTQSWQLRWLRILSDTWMQSLWKVLQRLQLRLRNLQAFVVEEGSESEGAATGRGAFLSKCSNYRALNCLPGSWRTHNLIFMLEKNWKFVGRASVSKIGKPWGKTEYFLYFYMFKNVGFDWNAGSISLSCNQHQ